jgi:hypothetical protein
MEPFTLVLIALAVGFGTASASPTEPGALLRGAIGGGVAAGGRAARREAARHGRYMQARARQSMRRRRDRMRQGEWWERGLLGLELVTIGVGTELGKLGWRAGRAGGRVAVAGIRTGIREAGPAAVRSRDRHRARRIANATWRLIVEGHDEARVTAAVQGAAAQNGGRLLFGDVGKIRHQLDDDPTAWPFADEPAEPPAPEPATPEPGPAGPEAASPPAPPKTEAPADNPIPTVTVTVLTGVPVSPTGKGVSPRPWSHPVPAAVAAVPAGYGGRGIAATTYEELPTALSYIQVLHAMRQRITIDLDRANRRKIEMDSISLAVTTAKAGGAWNHDDIDAAHDRTAEIMTYVTAVIKFWVADATSKAGGRVENFRE